MGKCAWCGEYIRDSADKKAFNNAMGLMGLDLITKPLGKALVKQYCSKKCEMEAKAAKGGGKGGGDGGDGGGGNSGGGESAPAAKKGSMLGDLMSATNEAFAMQAEREKAEKATLESIIAMRFDGSPDDIALDLNGLMARVKQTKGGLFATQEEKAMRATLLEKIEFGIMKLQKVDASSASFFQKKFDELKK